MEKSFLSYIFPSFGCISTSLCSLSPFPWLAFRLFSFIRKFDFCRNLNERGVSEFVHLITLFVSFFFPKPNKITWLLESSGLFTSKYIKQCLVHNPSSLELFFSNTFLSVKSSSKVKVNVWIPVLSDI